MGQLISDNKTKMSGEQMTCKGTLRGHNGWITQIATTPVFPDMLLSASRDKTIIMWQLTREEGQYGIPKRRLNGHSHFVSDVVISSDGQFCLSGSSDGTLRLWDLASGNTTRRFIGHTKDVLSVAFSADNRQIDSAARDRTIKLWNTLGICKYTIQEQGHTEWVSCVRFSPLAQNPVIVSSGWDKLVKVWNLSNCKLKRDCHGHSGYLNTVTFSPNRYWLCAAAGAIIKIWDLEQKVIVEELKPEVMGHKEGSPPVCTSLCWSSDGQTLFAGYTDNLIRVWSLSVPRALA